MISFRKEILLEKRNFNFSKYEELYNLLILLPSFLERFSPFQYEESILPSSKINFSFYTRTKLSTDFIQDLCGSNFNVEMELASIVSESICSESVVNFLNCNYYNIKKSIIIEKRISSDKNKIKNFFKIMNLIYKDYNKYNDLIVISNEFYEVLLCNKEKTELEHILKLNDDLDNYAMGMAIVFLYKKNVPIYMNNYVKNDSLFFVKNIKKVKFNLEFICNKNFKPNYDPNTFAPFFGLFKVNVLYPKNLITSHYKI
jgi:hypothetical protein